MSKDPKPRRIPMEDEDEWDDGTFENEEREAERIVDEELRRFYRNSNEVDDE